MYTHVRPSSEPLMNYVALPWVAAGEPLHINHGSPTLLGQRARRVIVGQFADRNRKKMTVIGAAA